MAKRERYIKKRNHTIAKLKKRREAMNENTGVVEIKLDEKRASLLERRIAERDQLANQEEQLNKLLAQTAVNKMRAQGKCDGLVEMIAEEQGYDFTKVGQYNTDTEKKILTLTFQQEPKPETPAPTEEPVQLRELTSDDNVAPTEVAEAPVKQEEKEVVNAN